jgi:hypothetical protein
MAFEKFPPKDPDETDYRVFVWCSKKTGLNDGSANDTGDLQGATISTATVTVATGLTKDSQNTNAISINGVDYDANTTVTVWLSGGTDETSYLINCEVELSDGRVLQKTARQRVAAL